MFNKKEDPREQKVTQEQIDDSVDMIKKSDELLKEMRDKLKNVEKKLVDTKKELSQARDNLSRQIKSLHDSSTIRGGQPVDKERERLWKREDALGDLADSEDYKSFNAIYLQVKDKLTYSFLSSNKTKESGLINSLESSLKKYEDLLKEYDDIKKGYDNVEKECQRMKDEFKKIQRHP